MAEGAMIVRDGEAERLEVLGVDVRFLCRAEDTGKAWSLMDSEIPQGAGPPPHHHPWAEAYFVISGEVDFDIDGRTERMGGGDFLYAPADTVHAFRGASDAPARMLIFDAPAHAESFFKELGQAVRRIPEDLPKVPGIGERHKVQFVRP